MSLRFAELFAGAGGLSMGLERAGWESVWHAEIADAPRAILTHHWPDIPLLGDVTTLDGKALTALHGPITLLAGGSPCQDLSVAGKRAGLGGARSGLFYEQMRLWDETGADLCLWENVDGARSSNNGQDFGEVLRAFVGAAVPVPSDGWRSAGVAAGPRGVAAWRVLDAQYFGVPQRRRRVFVLGTRTGSVDPAQVLSLAESLRGDTPQSGEAGEGTAAGADDGVEAEGGVVPLKDPYAKGVDDRNSICGDIGGPMFTLRAEHAHGVMAFDALNQSTDTVAHSLRASQKMDGASWGGVLAFHMKGDGGDFQYELSTSMRANADSYGGAPPCVCITGETTHALTHEGADASEDGTGRGTPIVAFNETGHEKWTEERIAGSLNAHEAREAHTLVMEAEDARAALQANPVATEALRSLRQDDGAEAIQRPPRGSRRVRPAEVLQREVYGGSVRREAGEGESVVDDGAPPRPEALPTGTVRELREGREDGRPPQERRLAGQPAREPGAPVSRVPHPAPQVGIPRRLTPRECERLQGWPDDHTLVPDAKGKLLSDAARYKACGNGVASPVAHWIGERLAAALATEAA